MTRSGAGRRAAGWLLGLWLALASAWAVPPAPAPFTVVPHLPLGPCGKAGGILPVAVELHSERALVGALVAHYDDDSSLRVSLPLQVGKGVFHFELLVPVHAANHGGATRLVVDLIEAGGRSVLPLPVALDFAAPLNPWGHSGGYNRYNQGQTARRELLVGWLAAKPGAVHPGPEDEVLLAPFTPLDAPRNVRAYDALDAVVVTGGGAERLQVEQVAALVTWVRQGGRVLFASDALTREDASNALLTACGVTLAVNQPTTRLEQAIPSLRPPAPEPVYAGRNGNIFSDSRNFVGPPAPPPEAPKVTVGGRHITLGGQQCGPEPGTPHEARATFGLGEVVVTCMALGDQRDATVGTTSVAAGTAIVQELLGEQVDVSAIDGINSYAYYNSVSHRFDRWIATLEGWTGLAPISWMVVLGYLLVFVVLVTIVERVVLRRARRLHWMWWTTTALVILFCLGAQTLSSWSRGFRSQRRTLTIQDFAAEGGGRLTVYDYFVTARARAHELTVGTDAALYLPDDQGKGGSAALAPAAGTALLARPVWSGHPWIVVRGHQERAPFTADLRAAGDQITGTVHGAVSQYPALTLCYQGNLYLLKSRDDHTWEVSGAVSAPAWGNWPTERQGAAATWPLRLHDSLLAAHIGNRASSARVFFGPALLPMPSADPHAAWLLAFPADGPVPALDANPMHSAALHLLRQVVPVATP